MTEIKPIKDLFEFVEASAAMTSNEIILAFPSEKSRDQITNVFTSFEQCLGLYTHITLRTAFIIGGDSARTYIQDNLSPLLIKSITDYLIYRFDSNISIAEAEKKMAGLSDYFISRLNRSELMYSQLSNIGEVPDDFSDRMLIIFEDLPTTDGFFAGFGKKKTIKSDELLSRGFRDKVHSSIIDLDTGFFTIEKLVRVAIAEMQH